MAPCRGEVWLYDLGLAAKTRPVLIVSTEYGDSDRDLVTVVPHTTQLRGSQFEIAVKASFLRPGAFLVQGIATYPRSWAIRKLGTIQASQMQSVLKGLAVWLGLEVAETLH